jgi:hypothetical protein
MANTILELVRMNGMKSPLAALSPYLAPSYEKIVFVDRANGSDAQDGSNWDQAMKTINKACDEFYGGTRDKARGRHFAIMFRGRLTYGNRWLTQQIIDIPGVHLIGGGQLYGDAGGWDSCYVTDSTLLTANARLSGMPAITKAGLQIQADDVMVSGLKFYSCDQTVTHLALAVLDYDSTAGSDNSGRNVLITNNTFQGDWESGTTHVSGVGMNGTECSSVVGNKFYGCEYGIILGSGGQRYVDSCIIKDNVVISPYKGIFTGGTNDVTDNMISDNYIVGKRTYGWTLTYGIDAGGSHGNLFARNIVGNATETTAFNYGSNNHWILNYHTTAGGTLANPDA